MADASLFVHRKGTGIVYVLIYVHDFIVTGMGDVELVAVNRDI